jgi:hypothetical protein
LEYLRTEDILPSATASQDLSKALSGISKQEWPEIFNTLNSVRRLALHHGALILGSAPGAGAGAGAGTGAGKQPTSMSLSALHSLVLGVLKQVDSLRSAVAKNALLTLGDMFQGLKKAMDAEVMLAVSAVLKASYLISPTVFSSALNSVEATRF